MKFYAPKLGSVYGVRLFFNPLAITSFFQNLTYENEDRKEDFYLNPNIYSFLDTDSVVVRLPSEYIIETKPKECKIEEVFESYKNTIDTSVPNQITYKREVVVKGGTYPKESFKLWMEFIKAVNRADRQRTVLKKIP